MSQYKNRTICVLVAKFPALFGLQASWTWLEADNDKDPRDSVGGAVEKKAET